MKFSHLFVCCLGIAGLIYGCDDDSSKKQNTASGPENTEALCSDKIDNDQNGLTDCQEPDCQWFTVCSNNNLNVPENTVELCTDQKDNDNNGLTDCEEPDCQWFTACIGDNLAENTLEKCTDNVDNNHNGLTDCEEDDCFWFSECQAQLVENTVERCSDGKDNDKNGEADCADSNCKLLDLCEDIQPENTEALCKDGLDNDNNGKADCLDANCLQLEVCQQPENTEALCADNIDNDNNGIKDCAEDSCKSFRHCNTVVEPEGCTDGDASCTGQLRKYCENKEWKSEYCTIACGGGKCQTCEEAFGPESCIEGTHSWCTDGEQHIVETCKFGCEGVGCAACVVGTKQCNEDGKTLESCELDANGKSAWVSTTCDGACVDNECKGCKTTGDKKCDNNELKTCNADHEFDSQTCEFGCENKACRNCVENALSCDADGKTVTKCTNNKFAKTDVVCANQCINGSCNDQNGNHLKDEFEPGFATAEECIKHSECTSGFCDSFIGKCSIKCTDSAQCEDGYICRQDGRCTPDAFVTVWKTTTANENIEFPTANGGTCVFTIDWGDGKTQDITSCAAANLKHTYAEAGEHTVRVYGDRAKDFKYIMAVSLSEDFMSPGMAAKLIKVISYGPVQITAGAFSKATNLYELSKVDIPDPTNMRSAGGIFAMTGIKGGVAKWDMSKVTTTRNMFRDATSFNECLKWDTSNLTNTSIMFKGASAFQDLSSCLNKWDVSKVTDMTSMFEGAKLFAGYLDKWNTGKVTSMKKMFANTYKFNCDISGWNVSSVTDMSYMFYGAIVFNKPIGSWNTSNVTTMKGMFASDSGFEEKYCLHDDEKSVFNQDIGSWDVSNVTDMSQMFQNAVKFNQDISRWNTSNVTDMNRMFFNAMSFNKPIGNWNVSKVTNMNYMFASCPFSKSRYGNDFNQDLSKWDVSKVTSMAYMFAYNKVFNHAGIIQWKNKLTSVKNMSGMFRGAEKFDQPIGVWDVSNVTNMSGMFAGYNPGNAYSDRYTIFNQDITSWNVSKVKDMSEMFAYNNYFNQEIGEWETKTSNVTNMSKMFFNAKVFDQKVYKWNVSKVQDMSEMFKYANEYSRMSKDWRPTYITNSQDCSKLKEMFMGTELSCGNVRDMLSSWSLKGICTANELRGSSDCD